MDAVKVFDSDAHVEESEETFSSIKDLPEFADAVPRVIEGEKRGSAVSACIPSARRT